MLTGQAPGVLTGILGAAGPIPQARGPLLLALPAATLRQRADVRRTEFAVAAALAGVAGAQARRQPNFAIGGSLGVNAATLAGLTQGASVVSTLLASVSLPLLDGGASQAQVQAEQAALAQARQSYRAAVLGALKDVEDALAAWHGDQTRLTALGLAAEAATAAALMARQRYSRGLVDFQTVLQTQRTQLSTQDSLVGAQADLGADQVRLLQALGGGWQPGPAIRGRRTAGRCGGLRDRRDGAARAVWRHGGRDRPGPAVAAAPVLLRRGGHPGGQGPGRHGRPGRHRAGAAAHPAAAPDGPPQGGVDRGVDGRRR